MNPYDPCVANMQVDAAAGDTSGVGKDEHGRVQMTVLWHVDDLKILFRNSFEITKLLLYLKNIYR